MENHKDLNLSTLRRYIIRYGAKAMDAFESDLFYDCQGVENISEGESVFWTVSESHTYLYSAKEMADRDLNAATIAGNRFNYRIDCYKDKYGDVMYAMTRVWEGEIDAAVVEYRKSLED